MDKELTEDYFRGDKAISALARNIHMVIDLVEATNPNGTTLSVTKAQYELLQRWPQASERAGFTFNDSVPYFKQYRLIVRRTG